MCLRRRQLDPKSRRIFAAGNVCFSSGLILTLFFEQGFSHRHPALFDGIRFLLVGCAISLVFWSACRRGGCASRS
jgi:hypothetical protein